MSLTLDYVSMPPKSQEISQIQNAEQIRYEHGQQEMAAQFQQRRQKHSGKQKNNSSDNKKETKKEPHFDMRI